MKYTPEPWKWYWKINEKLEAECGVYSENVTGQVISVCRAPRYESEKQWKANARLIASVPELLKACKLSKSLLEGLGREKGNVYKDICEAIAKAESQE